jgi:hypothetical protein
MKRVAAHAQCRNCDWSNEATDADKRAKRHSEGTGHIVSVNVTMAQRYHAGRAEY